MQKHLIKVIAVTVIIATCASCKKFVEVNAQVDNLQSSQVFTTEAGANAAVNGIYRSLMENFAASSYNATILTGQTSDEVYSYFPAQDWGQFTHNSILSSTSYLPWSSLYQVIYQSNSAIENIQGNNKLPLATINQLTGEAKFARAICYHYLVNLFGAVPLITTTDVAQNRLAPRATIAAVDSLIIVDLKEAAQLLATDYRISGGDRTRANIYAASALLARVFLYQRDWANAEAASSIIIANSTQYGLLGNIDSFGIHNNREAILQWAFNSTDGNMEAANFIFRSSPSLACTSFLMNAFEPGDRRRQKWISSGVYGGQTVYFPHKYKIVSSGGNEYYTVLRLAEQWLIRAEARAQQNNIGGAVADLNIVRSRAGLGAINGSISKDSCLNAIFHERQVELFAETGHRWFDLKRGGKIDTILGAEKAGDWKSTAALYPIPLGELQKNPNLTQNPGY